MKLGFFNILILVLAVNTATANDVLLYFTADWCKPCREMKPIIKELESQVEIRYLEEKNQKEFQKYNVKNIPTFVFLSGGREQGRIVGLTSKGSLIRLIGGQSNQRFGLEARLHRATVGVTGPEPNGRLVLGSGVVIGSGNRGSLIATCAHTFDNRDQNKSILVSLFDSNGKVRKTIKAELWAIDKKSDCSLLFVKGVFLDPVGLGKRTTTYAVGDQVVTVGCSEGQPPSLQQHRIHSINKYLGPSNFELTGSPANGRSGGGVFKNGVLIGICNAADRSNGVGLYCGLPAVLDLIDGCEKVTLNRSKSPSVTVCPIRGRRMPVVPMESIPMEHPSMVGACPNCNEQIRILHLELGRLRQQVSQMAMKQGPPGRPGKLGVAGRNGKNGTDGRGIQEVDYSAPTLSFLFTDGTTQSFDLEFETDSIQIESIITQIMEDDPDRFKGDPGDIGNPDDLPPVIIRATWVDSSGNVRNYKTIQGKLGTPLDLPPVRVGVKSYTGRVTETSAPLGGLLPLEFKEGGRFGSD